MFNPYVPFTPMWLNAFIQAGKKYFVRQSFPRGENILEPEVKGCFLYCQYTDLASAQTHMGILKNDTHRFLFDWEQEEHKIRLVKAANGIEGYKIFANVLHDDTEKMVSTRVRQLIRAYLQYKLKWYPRREDGLVTHFDTHFGELYIELKFRTREVRVPFIDIEKFKP